MTMTEKTTQNVVSDIRKVLKKYKTTRIEAIAILEISKLVIYKTGVNIDENPI